MKTTIEQATDKGWYVLVTATNGEKLCWSRKRYPDEDGATVAYALLRQVERQVFVEESEDGQWYFHIAGRGDLTLTSENYVNKAHAHRKGKEVADNLPPKLG